MYYLAGTVYEALGERAKAKESYQKALDVEIFYDGDEYVYYHGLALQKLGGKSKAKKIFKELLAETQNQESGSDFFRQFEGSRSGDMRLARDHYRAGLAYKGMGDDKKAKAQFKKALKLDPGHVWSKVYLESLR
jgi:tetratricopeptide (TPR) repeat protein